MIYTIRSKHTKVINEIASAIEYNRGLPALATVSNGYHHSWVDLRFNPYFGLKLLCIGFVFY